MRSNGPLHQVSFASSFHRPPSGVSNFHCIFNTRRFLIAQGACLAMVASRTSNLSVMLWKIGPCCSVLVAADAAAFEDHDLRVDTVLSINKLCMVICFDGLSLSLLSLNTLGFAFCFFIIFRGGGLFSSHFSLLGWYCQDFSVFLTIWCYCLCLWVFLDVALTMISSSSEFMHSNCLAMETELSVINS